jgi:hypothetical protein
MLRKRRPQNVTSPIVSKMILEYIRAYHHENTFPPTYREIAAYCHITLGRVTRYLEELEKQGKIYREIGKKRGLMLLDEDQDGKNSQ